MSRKKLGLRRTGREEPQAECVKECLSWKIEP